MKNELAKIKFVEFRSTGKSYAEICLELNICKQTAVNWSKELQHEIGNLKAIEFDRIQRLHRLHYEARIELLGLLLEKLRKEVDNRDFSSLPTEKILEQIVKISSAVFREKSETIFKQIVPNNLDEMLSSLNSGLDTWSA
jgi:hypothetical protein